MMRPVRTTVPDTRQAADAADVDLLAPRLRMAVVRLARRLRQEDAAADGLTISTLSALHVIDATTGCTLTQLAEIERVSSPTMCRIVDRLVELELAERIPSATDRRSFELRTTPAGRRRLAKSRRLRTQFLATKMATFSAEERTDLARAAELLERLLDDDR